MEAADPRRKELLLKQYFDDVLYRDVALRHEVRDLATLRGLAVHLLGQTASLVTFQRLAGLLGVSVAQVRTYCGHLQEAMLLDLLPIYSQKSADRTRNPHKVFAVDTGLRNAVCFTATPDLGRLAETVVFGALQRTPQDGLFYWRNGREVDLVVRRGERVVRAVQVAYELREAATVAREFEGLERAAEVFPAAVRLLVVQKPQKTLPRGVAAAPGVLTRLLWRFLLAPAV